MGGWVESFWLCRWGSGVVEEEEEKTRRGYLDTVGLDGDEAVEHE